MTPTHVLIVKREIPCRAWRYLKTSSRPLWVVKNFHDLGDGKLSHRLGHAVPEGDWIVDDLKGTASTFTNEEFEKMFKALAGPASPAGQAKNEPTNQQETT